MSSQISSILSSLASASVSVSTTGGTVTGLTGSTLRQSLPSANLPVRVLSTLNQRADTSATFKTMARNMLATWRVTDLMLWAAINADRGIMEHEPDLLAYMVGYITMVQANRTIATNCTIQDVSMQAGLYEWPQGSGQTFYGVECTLTISEVI